MICPSACSVRSYMFAGSVRNWMFAEEASKASDALLGSIERECKSKYSPIIVFTCWVVSANVISRRARCFAVSGLSFDLAFSHEGEKILFLFGRDLRTLNVADSTLTGVEAVSLDMPLAHILTWLFQSGRLLVHFALKLFHFSPTVNLNSLHCWSFLHWNRQAPDWWPSSSHVYLVQVHLCCPDHFCRHRCRQCLRD